MMMANYWQLILDQNNSAHYARLARSLGQRVIIFFK